MTQERKQPRCPYCGTEMQDLTAGDYYWYICYGCSSCSPIAYSRDDAYSAATHRAKEEQA